MTDIKIEHDDKKDIQLETNADRVRNMTNEELAEFLIKVLEIPNCMLIDEDCKHFPNISNDDSCCRNCFKEWLESKYVTE